ncbi:MAG: hypothetical protein ABI620_10630 [Chloroflexota bacterium]
MTSPVPSTDPLFPARWLPVAERICEQFYAEFPDHDARYGARGRDFCAHDNAYLVAWLVDSLELAGADSFKRNVDWLRDLLAARGFPMEAFQRNLDLVGEAVAELRPLEADQVRQAVALARNSGVPG